MVKMYGTELCPDVRAAIAMFKDKNIEVDFRDFSVSVKYPVPGSHQESGILFICII